VNETMTKEEEAWISVQQNFTSFPTLPKYTKEEVLSSINALEKLKRDSVWMDKLKAGESK
jgi:hypothetical protein